MPLSIGVNLRVTGHCNQGGRKYMEDMFSVAYQQSSNDRELEYAFFGIFDGHGGGEAATFAKENLMDIIVKQKNFWSDNDEDVLKAIRDGYVNTHYAMWRELDKWPRTASGLPSTAGTTASIAFIRKGKIYIGHVGDSGIILGYQEKCDPIWKSTALTRDHKPECGVEMTRIQESGGKVISKSGVPRVVWNRPRLGHKGPVRRSTHIDEIPFLAIARSLGDLWSYNSELNTFVVSPEPDVKVVKIDVKSHRCLIFGTDGLWNMLTPQAAVTIVQSAERHNEKHLIASQQTGNGQGSVQVWINPSKSLVDRALDKWSITRLRADNTSVVTLMLDPPGPTHSEILLSQKRDQLAASRNLTQPMSESSEAPNAISSAHIHNAYSNTIHKAQNSSEETVIYPDPMASINSTPPSYLEIQKQPDSSNNLVDGITNISNENSNSYGNSNDSTSTNSSNCSSENKYSRFPSKEEMWSNQSSLDVPSEESIQVAEISSSNVSDEHSSSSEKDNNAAIVASETMLVESILCMEEALPNEEMIAAETTEFMLERESWLQQVPEAEQYPENIEKVDLQTIRFTEPQEPRLRRSVTHESSRRINTGSPSTSRGNNIVLRQTTINSKRRHSTGAPLSSQRPQQKQRRSLTPKSSVGVSATYLSGGNKLKRGAKAMLSENSFEEQRIGAVARHSGECRYEIKNRDIGEPCLKRRTRSEDIRNLQQDENDPSNQKVERHDRLRWPVADTMISRTNTVLNTSTGGMQERRLSSPNSFKRRNLEKKVTPVKTIRRPSINRSTGRHPIRDSFWSDQGRASRTGASCTSNRRQTVVNIINSISESMSPSTSSSTTSSSSAPKRWLRSDTIAATPIKTLRSRNVDIAGHTIPSQMAHQYGTIKANRILESTSKFKPQVSPNGSMLSSSGSQTAVTKTKSTVCTSTPPPTATSNRIRQNCSVTPVVNSNSGSCISTNSSSSGSISKRAKTPYNPSARSLSTRSRIKRFSK